MAAVQLRVRKPGRPKKPIPRAAFLDADHDGLLDLYVCRYGHWTLDTNTRCGDRESGRRVFCSPLTVEAADGKTAEIPLDKVKKANLKFEW